MKIALIGPTYPFRGGIAHYTTLLCRALRERHDVAFLSLTRQYPRWLFPGRTQRDESRQALRVDNEPVLDSIGPLSWRRTARRAGEVGADLLLFSWWHPFFAPAFGSVARRARRRHGIPSCFLCHNVVPHERSFVDRRLSAWAFGGAASFITHSREDRENLQRLRPGARVLLNPHPTYAAFAPEAEVTAEQAKAELGLTGKRVLLFFGYVRPYKGLLDLLAAMDVIERDDVHLLVVGEFYEPLERYRPRIDPLRAAGRLTLVDRYVANEEIPRYFAAADLVMIPYRSATQSGIVQMAYGFRRPVIATRVGGLPEAVLDGETGYLVPPSDPGALAAAVGRHLDGADPVAFRSAIERESARYSWDRMVDTVEQAADAAAVSANRCGT